MRIDVKNISKTFGNNKALDDVSFTIEEGKAFGILGRNGAGKTTFIRVLLGIIEADGGEILIDGKNIRNSKLKFGYLRGISKRFSL